MCYNHKQPFIFSGIDMVLIDIDMLRALVCMYDLIDFICGTVDETAKKRCKSITARKIVDVLNKILSEFNEEKELVLEDNIGWGE